MTFRPIGQARPPPEVSSSTSISLSLKDRLQSDKRASSSSSLSSNNSAPLLERVQGISGSSSHHQESQYDRRDNRLDPGAKSPSRNKYSRSDDNDPNSRTSSDLSSRIGKAAAAGTNATAANNVAISDTTRHSPRDDSIIAGASPARSTSLHRFDDRRLDSEVNSGGDRGRRSSLRGGGRSSPHVHISRQNNINEDRGRIRVSEEGDVWRSPPQSVHSSTVPPRSANSPQLLQQPSHPSREAIAGKGKDSMIASNNMSSRSSIGPVHARSERDRPIAKPLPTVSSSNADSGYSPLPPFARAGTGAEEVSSDRIPRSIPPPPSGNARQYHRFQNQRDSYGRGPSVPPYVTASSNTSVPDEPLVLRDSYRPPPRAGPSSRTWANDRERSISASSAWYPTPPGPSRPNSTHHHRPNYPNQVWRAPTSRDQFNGPAASEGPAAASPRRGESYSAAHTQRPASSQRHEGQNKPEVPSSSRGQPASSGSSGSDRSRSVSSRNDSYPSRPVSAPNAVRNEPSSIQNRAPASRQSEQTLPPNVPRQSEPPSRTEQPSVSRPSLQGYSSIESRNVVKREPATPPKSLSDLATQSTRDFNAQRPPVPLFAPPTLSPEERKSFSFTQTRAVSPSPQTSTQANVPGDRELRQQGKTDQVPTSSNPSGPTRPATATVSKAQQPTLQSRPQLQPRSQTMKREVSSPPPPSLPFRQTPSANVANANVVNTSADRPSHSQFQEKMRIPKIAPAHVTTRENGQTVHARYDSDMDFDELGQDDTDSEPSHVAPPTVARDAPNSKTTEATASNTKHLDGKGKGRARSPPPASTAATATAVRSNGLPNSGVDEAPRSGASSTIISLISDDDEDPADVQKQKLQSRSEAKAHSTQTSSEVQGPGNAPIDTRAPHHAQSGVLAGEMTATPLHSPALAQRPDGEELSWTFNLPDHLCGRGSNDADIERHEYRKFVEECYQELELRYQGPLQRCEEILRSDRVRLIYTQLNLFPHELAIPLPMDCLRSSEGSVDDREKNRRSFETKEIVRLAREGREPETTRLTAAYLIIVFKADGRSAKTGANLTKSSDLSVPSISAGQVSQSLSRSLTDLPKEVQEKKRKRELVKDIADDSVSVASTNSNTSLSKDKKRAERKAAKQAKLAEIPSTTTGTAQPPKPTITKAAAPSAPTPSSAKPKDKDSLLRQFGKPRLQSVSHTMHGSLSNKVKDTREKPRVFFHSPAMKGYAAVSMRGHVHVWRSTRETTSLVLEDKAGDAALTVQAALWSEDQQLGILGYVSGTAGSVAPLQIFNLQSTKVCRACCCSNQCILESDLSLCNRNLYGVGEQCRL